ncbi:hypothetical protein GQ600_17595 [Phytophthora cactorum]|nr:hypothetical protein GQ600_17595 [Phytophthora cactorum]
MTISCRPLPQQHNLQKNGELLWLCAEHRDHQNAMQRTRYRRTAIKTKKKMAEIEKKSQNKARKIERFELVYSSPHIAKNPAASTSADTKASASASGDDDATAPVELVTTKDISPTSARSEPQEIPPAATTCEVEDSAHGTGVSTQRSPAAIWSRGTAVLGLTTFDGVCSCVNTHRTPKVVVSQLQYAIAPAQQSCVLLPPTGSSVVIFPDIISPSSVRDVPEVTFKRLEVAAAMLQPTFVEVVAAECAAF